MVKDENLQEELKKIDEFFSRLSVKELEEKLEKSGILELNEMDKFFNIFMCNDIYYQEYKILNHYYNERIEYIRYSDEKEGTRCHQAIAA